MRRTAVALAVGASLALAACGDDDEKDSAADSGNGGSSASAAPQKVTITATGTDRKPTFEVTGSAKAGAATIELQNDLDKGGVDGQLVFIAEEHSDKEIAAELAKAVDGKTVVAWFEAAGGPGEAKPGESSSVTQELKAGTYAVLSGNGEPKLPLTKIEVEGEGGPAFEAPAAKITATEYAFKGKNVKAGEPVLFENGGGTWHHFLASKLKSGATIEDATKFLTDEKGKPPFTDEEGSGLESTVLDAGVSQTVEFAGGPGKYAFFCFLADKQGGGPPHVAKGMVSEVVVE